jgi:hypothetical protein
MLVVPAVRRGAHATCARTHLDDNQAAIVVQAQQRLQQAPAACIALRHARGSA